jgi:hypothetical protein
LDCEFGGLEVAGVEEVLFVLEMVRKLVVNSVLIT